MKTLYLRPNGGKLKNGHLTLNVSLQMEQFLQGSSIMMIKCWVRTHNNGGSEMKKLKWTSNVNCLQPSKILQT